VVSEFQRARRPAQKQQRREAILAAAAALLEEGGLDAVGLNPIARRAGIAKSNIYRYFESREDVLLQLLAEDEAIWVGKLELALAPLAGSCDPRGVARIVSQTLVAERRLCVLSTVLGNVLEQNVSKETVVSFKQQALALGIRIANSLQAALPSLSRDVVMHLQHAIHGAVAGLWPLSHPTPLVAEVLERPEFEVFQHDFARDLERSVTWLVEGALRDSATG
jgi:AcrR family transcriptional regulator